MNRISTVLKFQHITRESNNTKNVCRFIEPSNLLKLCLQNPRKKSIVCKQRDENRNHPTYNYIKDECHFRTQMFHCRFLIFKPKFSEVDFNKFKIFYHPISKEGTFSYQILSSPPLC